MIAPESVTPLGPIDPLEIHKDWRLDPSEYYPQAQTKDLIVLHHTVGGSAWSTFKWWRDDPRHISTAYIVGRDGTAYEVFPPDCWAWHLGVKHEGIEKRSIGIELASEGGLLCKRRNGNGPHELWAFDGAKRLGLASMLKKSHRVVHLEEPWRGYSWFDAYEPAQIMTTIALSLYLTRRFDVPRKIPAPQLCRGPADLSRWLHYRGVLHHAMLRRDKSDLHPRFPFETLRTTLEAA